MSTTDARDLTVDGIRFRVYRPGPEVDGVLVILHGLFGSADNWQSQARELSLRRLVLVPDMPNHGRSLHTEQVGFPDQARAMWAAIDAALGESASGGPVDLLGHSMGGKVAMAMAFTLPSDVGRLIVVDISPRAYPPRHDQVFAAMADVAAARPRSRSEAESIMARTIPQKAVRLFLLKSLVRGDDGVFDWLLNYRVLRDRYDEISAWPFDAAEHSFGGPTLLVAAGRSPYVTAEDRRAFNRWFADSRIETIAEAGHWLHAEARDRFVALVSGFLP